MSKVLVSPYNCDKAFSLPFAPHVMSIENFMKPDHDTSLMSIQCYPNF